MNISTVNELIQSLESAGELSIKERKYLEVMRWAIRVAGERDAELNAERVWERAMLEVCGEDGPASVASEIRALQVLRDTRIQALNSQVEQLAAENVAMKSNAIKARRVIMSSKFDYWSDRVELFEVVRLIIETPATDRIVAEAEARGVEKAIECIVQTITPNHETILKEFAQQLREGADK
ncbi:hypothetical protein I6K64_12695 [Klebsiella oxytoca]|nr:hypothetical protein [Klebsiella oxytoca]QRS18657.1 hypothetical protein I6K64_12695 [Klebsiella oxytoca]